MRSFSPSINQKHNSSLCFKQPPTSHTFQLKNKLKKLKSSEIVIQKHPLRESKSLTHNSTMQKNIEKPVQSKNTPG